MARTTTPLTNTQVKQSKPTDKRQKLSDGGGLQLWISPNGSKSWMLDYIHPITKKRLSMSFGIYPAVSLADARKKRAEAKELIANGIDPKEHREDQSRLQELTNSHTLQTVASDWFEIKKSKVAETTSKSLWRNFDKHLFPKLGHRPIDKFNPKRSSALKLSFDIGI
ncbi:hypothetical protein GCM10008107_12150 [Psychrosphaera saromensis]|uniref:Integrase DNA-binding domain-containing protein n=1 Tax=Psychrosphaera saromensis TaxID=716813 RepID=A0A2S7UUX1_9GAMM|nr:integrase arm-type DNA-binding domain-containing protein [Psychrosphaera saromensis]PQJ53528.1 hypothetical protein BTO11_07510 [Psychrosphaera saromensis]GHB64562.1 hypothetical protein GCM10008107_12150 [Psychrosphaera saromensis]GLQ15718.1 hypothetical protein GCM10007917_31730 [Psychrosphaera saromensis]